MPHLVRAPDPDDLAELGQFDLGLLMGGPDESIADMEPSRMFVDVVNPTLEEVRRWAQSGQDEPIEDFEIILAEPANLGFLIELIADQTCPAGDFLAAQPILRRGPHPAAEPVDQRGSRPCRALRRTTARQVGSTRPPGRERTSDVQQAGLVRLAGNSRPLPRLNRPLLALAAVNALPRAVG